jgi:hypothetical protein
MSRLSHALRLAVVALVLTPSPAAAQKSDLVSMLGDLWETVLEMPPS